MEPVVTLEEWPKDPAYIEAQLPLGHIEILSRTGQVRQRFPVLDGPLRIGRAYSNDIVLEDPYVCPLHAEIFPAGAGLLFRDTGSVNGLHTAAGKRQPSIIVVSGESLRIGRTTVRFHGKDHPVAPALVDHLSRSSLGILERRLPLLLIFAAAIGYILLDLYLSSSERLREIAVMKGLVGPAITLLLWSGIWAFASRLAKSRWYYLAHCGIAGLGLLSFGFLQAGTEYFCFAAGLDGIQEYVGILGLYLLCTAVIFTHLQFASSALPRRLAGAAALVSAALIGVIFLFNSVKEDFLKDPSFEATLKPPAFRLVSGRSPADFLQEGEALREKIEKARATPD